MPARYRGHAVITAKGFVDDPTLLSRSPTPTSDVNPTPGHLYPFQHQCPTLLPALSTRDNCAEPLFQNKVAYAAGLRAWYVTQAMAAGAGIGRSEGCFALSATDHVTVMDLLGPDRLLLAVKA